MYKASKFLGQTNKLFTYALKDSCFTTQINILAKSHIAGSSISTLEISAIANEYYVRKMNVARNVAAYYYSEYASPADVFRHDQNVINAYLPHLKFSTFYTANVLYYLCHASYLLNC